MSSATDGSNAETDVAIEPLSSAPSRVIALTGELVRDEPRALAVETPVQILFADVPFAVMMLTPADLIDFAYGFSLTEGMIDAVDDIRDVTLTRNEDGLVLRIALVGEKLQRHFARQRAMTGRTGCGVCGIDDLKALRRADDRISTPKRIPIAAIARALGQLDEGQALNVQTRAVHGAAWADLDGKIHAIREDVGRHNALDKLIGAAMRERLDPSDGFVVITSRCSFEMVEKAATFGAATLVAISAPTSLAIERAQTLGLTLVAIARRDTLTAFTHWERLETT